MKIELKDVIALLTDGKVERTGDLVKLDTGVFGVQHFILTDETLNAFIEAEEIKTVQLEEEATQAGGVVSQAKQRREGLTKLTKLKKLKKSKPDTRT